MLSSLSAALSPPASRSTACHRLRCATCCSFWESPFGCSSAATIPREWLSSGVGVTARSSFLGPPPNELVAIGRRHPRSVLGKNSMGGNLGDSPGPVADSIQLGMPRSALSFQPRLERISEEAESCDTLRQLDWLSESSIADPSSVFRVALVRPLSEDSITGRWEEDSSPEGRRYRSS